MTLLNIIPYVLWLSVLPSASSLPQIVEIGILECRSYRLNTTNIPDWPIPQTNFFIRNTNSGPQQDLGLDNVQMCLINAVAQVDSQIRRHGSKGLPDSHPQYPDAETGLIFDIRLSTSLSWEQLRAIIEGFQLYYDQVLKKGVDLHFDILRLLGRRECLIAQGRIGKIETDQIP